MAAFNKNKIPLPAHYALMTKQINKITGKNKCCLLGESNCKERPIKSHSIQEASLRKISDSSSHVYHFASPDFSELQHIYGRAVYLPKKISTSKASVFNGFCIKHDTELFRCVEIGEIEPTAEQLNALHFRAASRSLEGNFGLIEAIKGIITYDYPEYHDPEIELVHLWQQIKILKNVIQQMEGEVSEIINGLPSVRTIMDKYILLRLKNIPDIMCSTLLAPTFCFKGMSLINKEVRDYIQHLCITVSSDEVGGYIVLQWSSIDSVSSSFIKSFIESGYDLNRLVACLFILSDVVFSPAWWDSLNENKQKQIMRFAMTPYFIQWLKDSSVPFKTYNNFITNEVPLISWDVTQYKSNA